LDLAVAVRTTQRHVSFIESGRAAPSRDMILRFVGGDGYSVAGGGRPWFVRYACTLAPLRGVQPDPSETGDWPDGRGAKMTGAAQPNNDLRGQKADGRQPKS
jgi:hypothetical protein